MKPPPFASIVSISIITLVVICARVTAMAHPVPWLAHLAAVTQGAGVVAWVLVSVLWLHDHMLRRLERMELERWLTMTAYGVLSESEISAMRRQDHVSPRENPKHHNGNGRILRDISGASPDVIDGSSVAS